MAQDSTRSAKRFGVRYGRSIRLKVAQAEGQYRKKLVCPYCNKNAAKRMASGIYACKSCGSVFTGRAYGLATER